MRPVAKRGREQKGGREKPPAGSPSALLEADIRSGLRGGCSGGQLGFVSIFVRDHKLSVPCLLDLERKMFLSVFWKQMTPNCSSDRVFVCLVLSEDSFIDYSISLAATVCMDCMLPDASLPSLVLKDLPQNNSYCGCPWGCCKCREV